jgi:hypothetical protein
MRLYLLNKENIFIGGKRDQQNTGQRLHIGIHTCSKQNGGKLIVHITK